MSRDPDPRPIPPEKPLPMDCCESGCPICVWDAYSDALQYYEAQLAAWKARNAGIPASGAAKPDP